MAVISPNRMVKVTGSGDSVLFGRLVPIDSTCENADNVHKRVRVRYWEAEIMEIGIVEVRDNLAEIINRVAYGGERAVLKRRGKGVAVVVSMEDLALLEALENDADVKAALKARKEKGAVPLEQVKARLGMK